MSFLIALVMALAPVIVTSSTDYPSNNNNNNTVFWVAPTLEDCQGRTPCNTLAGYQYTASNSIWVFLQGRHYVSTSVVVEGVSNVTWIGEELCYDEEQRCSIHFDNSPLENGSDRKYYLHFKSSRLIAIKHLKFTSSHATSSTIFSIEDTHNCLLHSVTISEGCGLSVSDSTGYLNITNSLFRHGIHHFMNSSIQPRRMNELMVNIIHSQFYDSKLILELMEESTVTSYTMITVSITSSTFVGKTSQLTVKVFGFPAKTFSITVRHSLFTYSQSAVTVNSTIVVSDSSSVLQMPVIHMENVTITKGSSALTLLATYEVLSNMSCLSLYPQIFVSNCNFLLSGDMANRNNVRLVHAVLNYTELDKNHLYHCSAVDTGRRPLLVFTGTRIISNSIWSGIMYVEGFFWHHVSFGGDVVFRNNSRNVIQLQNSRLEIHGYNEIHSNNGEGIILSPSSQLLFSNNSELSIRDNKVPINGSGVRIEPTGDGIESFSEFVQCYIHKTVCPGWCFFQFIHSNGSAVSGEELTTFTASLNISGNTYDTGKYSNILNGHISNCFFKTSNGQTLLNPSVRMRFIRVKDDIESINMIPYQICLRHHTQHYKGEYCNQTTVVEIYSHQMVNLQVRVLKDLMIPVETELLVFMQNSTRQTRVASTYTSVLSTVASKNRLSTQIIILQTTPLRAGLEGYTVNHTVMLRKQSCPIGTLEKRSGPGCECSPHLLKGGFTCSYKNHTLIVKATHQFSWLGMYEGELMFSRLCSYCNSALEVDIRNLTENQQCEYGQGLLCRECPSGTSRTFGAKECRADCSNWWLLMIPLYALGGILLIVMLFVFNLTVMEGTINGAIFYSTIVWTLQGFVYNYIWPPFSAFDGALRFSFGISICLYEGMDRFAKSLLYYAFPIYLLLLVVIIIVSAHKLRLRIFTVPVISRRAVPVLATLMFMTYHKLTMCVSQGLAFAIIQNAETGEWNLHWKYQPTLLYFRGEHIALGVLSLLVKMLYLLPFTAVMLFGDLLRTCIRSLWFSHFLDVFHGAYRYPFGFWFGLRLLLRGVLIILHEFMPLLSYSHFDFITTLAIGTLWFIQITIKPFRVRKHPIKVHCTGKYKFISRMWKSFLSLQPSHFDSLFIMNSLIISVAAIHAAYHEAIPWLYTIIVNGSLALAIAEFTAIMIYHWKLYFYIPKWLKKRAKKLLKWSRRRRSRTCGNAVPVDDTAVHAIPIMTLELPPHNDTSSDDGSDQVDSDDSNQVDSDSSDQMDIDSDSDVTRTMNSDLFWGSNTMQDSLTEHLLK